MDNKRNSARGLSLLMQLENSSRRSMYDFGQYVVVHEKHPFGLDIPEKHFGGFPEIRFVGAGNTETSVDAFVVNIHQHLGYVDGMMLTKLRVISAPFPGGTHGQNHVFFEAWIDEQIIISGETTDFSGGGNAARNNLEDIFDVLSKVYGVEINRVSLPRQVNLRSLHRSSVPA